MRKIAIITAVLALGGAYAGYRGDFFRDLDDEEATWLAVQRSPTNPIAWRDLADHQTASDHLDSAEQAYLTALRLAPDDAEIHARYGFLLFGQGRSHDARLVLARARHLGSTAPLLDYTLELLSSSAEPPVPRDGERTAGAMVETNPDAAQKQESATCHLKLSREHAAGTWRVAARVQSRPVTLIVDTGASITTLEATLLDELVPAPAEGREIVAWTAAGKATLRTAQIDTLQVGDRQLHDLTVARCPDCGAGNADGLLGLDVLHELGFELSLTHGTLHDTSCSDN